MKSIKLFLFILWTLVSVTTALWFMLNFGYLGCIAGILAIIMWIAFSYKMLELGF